MADELYEGKALTEMSDSEILEEINRLRSRRQIARERRAVERSAAESMTKRKTNEVTGRLGAALDAIFADDTELCEKCGKPMTDGACGNLACEVLI